MAHTSDVAQAKNTNVFSLLGSVSLHGPYSSPNGELYGPCPICRDGDDRFHIKNNKWFCSHCTGRPGNGNGNGNGWYDTIDLAMRLHTIDFREAVSMLIGGNHPTVPPVATQKRSDESVPGAEWQSGAKMTTIELADRLWEQPRALSWLNGRGIDDTAIAKFNLGYTAGGTIDNLWFGANKRPQRGIIIPHWSQQYRTLFGLKIRTPTPDPKYYCVRGSKIHQGLFNSDSLIGNDVCFIVEGEFDVIALDSRISDEAAVVTLGGNSIKLADRWLPDLAHIKRVIICTDNDAAGNEAAKHWLSVVGRRGKRSILPGGEKDICEAIQKGVDVRQWAMNLIAEVL